MGKRITALAAVLMVTALPALAGGLTRASSKNAEAQKLIDQAWTLEHTDENAEIFKQCAALLTQADKLDRDNPAVLTELARYYWFYGNNLPKATREEQDKLKGIYGKGMNCAERSLALKETVPGHYWYAVNKAAGLEFSSIFAQAYAFPSIYMHSEWVTDHEPDYYYGGPGRLWTEILARVPKKAVELVGWDVQEAVDEIDRSLKVEPRYLDNYLYKARFEWVFYKNRDEALKLLDHELKQDPAAFPEK
jgi:tetratricopeptide (TPR) repeat protein